MAGVWAIDGVEVPASVARMLAYVAGGGAEGIVEPGGLKVLPLAVPGASIRVTPGAAMVANRYPGGGQQSYPIFEQVQQTVPIAATGSGGPRTDLVIARVRDPEFPGGGTPGVTFEVIQGVDAGAGAAYVQALSYPALALARVTLPASTATVTEAMITDLRSLARPRSERVVQYEQVSPINQDLTATGTFARYPNTEPYFRVPTWATHMFVQFRLLGVAVITGAVEGWARVEFGPAGQPTTQQGASRYFDYDNPTGGVSRVDLEVGAHFAIPAGDRGQMRILRMAAYKGGPGALRTHNGTQAVIDVQFYEQAV